MPEYADINNLSYPELGEAFVNGGGLTDGVYFVGPDLADNPADSLKTVILSLVAFPGVFDGVGSVELGFETRPLTVFLCIIGTLSTMKTFKASLSTALIRTDAARYAVNLPGCVDAPGCKLVAHKIFPHFAFGNKNCALVACYFQQLSDAN